MKQLISFFEIPATDFNRAVDFYQAVFNITLPVMECETEKMAFFMEGEKSVGAISSAENFRPSQDGVLIHFNCENIGQVLDTVFSKGGSVVIPETKIQAEGRGTFAVFTDSEGNRIGVYAD